MSSVAFSINHAPCSCVVSNVLSLLRQMKKVIMVEWVYLCLHNTDIVEMLMLEVRNYSIFMSLTSLCVQFIKAALFS